MAEPTVGRSDRNSMVEMQDGYHDSGLNSKPSEPLIKLQGPNLFGLKAH